MKLAMESSETVSTPIPSDTHRQVKAYAALNRIRVPEAYAQLISLALGLPSEQK